jgi:hypothetical protein
MKAVSPEGNEIIGTLEMIEGVARAEVSLTRHARLKVEFLGDTDLDWNSQATKTQNGERLFVCSRRKVWRESEVKSATRTRSKNQ